MEAQLLWQAGALVLFFFVSVLRCTLVLPYVAIKLLVHTIREPKPVGQCTFYEGVVRHARLLPARNAFKYNVRFAVVNLSQPPPWFAKEAHDHLTPDEARQLAGTDGQVLLLTDPACFGYVANPISVYYCYSAGGTLERAIAEVTNTPWGERSTFVFAPDGALLPKSLHVSPFMDMDAEWELRATAPGKALHLSVAVQHARHGRFFTASLDAEHAAVGAHLRNEEAGWATFARYGFMPYRVVYLIYWQALRLWWLGVPLFSPPNDSYRTSVLQRTSTCPLAPRYVWREAPGWPWRA